MTTQEYIESRIKNLKTVPDALLDSKLSTEEQIRAKLMSKKFRKLKATLACESGVERAIKNAVKNNEPLVISFLFGGNKLWRLDEAPEIDWAELFSLFYYVDWLKTVTAVHMPGVVLDYYSQDISVETMNNVPRSETDKYSEGFRKMIEWVSPYLPAGVTVTYRRHFEEFKNPDDYYQELELGKQEILKENNGQLPKLSDEMGAATELNVKLKPDQDKDPEWREKVELEHQAIFRTKTLSDKYLNDQSIVFACPTNYEGAVEIITGSTKRSYAKFWAAAGALEATGDTFHELVLTPKQLQAAKFEWQDISIEGLEGKNFIKIRIISKS
jgi:hypothetical protein